MYFVDFFLICSWKTNVIYWIYLSIHLSIYNLSIFLVKKYWFLDSDLHPSLPQNSIGKSKQNYVNYHLKELLICPPPITRSTAPFHSICTTTTLIIVFWFFLRRCFKKMCKIFVHCFLCFPVSCLIQNKRFEQGVK